VQPRFVSYFRVRRSRRLVTKSDGDREWGAKGVSVVKRFEANWPLKSFKDFGGDYWFD